MGIFKHIYNYKVPLDSIKAPVEYLLERFPHRLAILFAITCFATSVQATDPYAAALERLDSAVKERVDQMALGSQAAESPPVGEGNQPWVILLFFLVLIAWHLVLKLLDRRLTTQPRVTKTEADRLGKLYLEDPALASFLEQLKTGIAPPLLPATSVTQGKADALTKFFDSATAEIGKLESLLLAVKRSNDPALRQKKLAELTDRFRLLNYDSCRADLPQVWQISSSLEGLVKQIATAESNITNSGLQTVAGALDLLRIICAKRIILKAAPIRLLVIDDNAVCRLAVSSALKKVFDQPDLAIDGKTGLSMVQQNAYDCIFTDVEMPGMNGFELCEKIRQTELNRSTPVVFVTRHFEFDDRAKAVLSGGQHLLGKPFLFLEVAVKALTLVLRSRLEQSEKTSAPVEKNSKPSLRAKTDRLSKPVSGADFVADRKLIKAPQQTVAASLTS